MSISEYLKTLRQGAGLLGAACCLALGVGAARADEPMTLQSVIDQAQIERLITHYYYNFGREDAENFADFYADDAELILGTRSYKGREGIESAYGRGPANANQDRPARPQRWSFNVTISNPLITVHGDTATSQLIFTEYVIQNQGDPLQVTTQGREYATFVRTSDGWRYKTRQIVGGDDIPDGWKE
jgi:ketosteroid isomerase-like protein